MIKALLVLPALALALTACGSSRRAGQHFIPIAHPPTTGALVAPSPIATVSSSPTAAGATTAQVASVVAAQAAAIAKAASTIASCGSTYDASDPICTLGRLTYSTTVATLGVSFSGALSPTSPTYLGPPPAELSPLISTTKAAITQMAAAESALEAACKAAASESCADATAGWPQAQGSVTSALAAWSPYTH
jgi:hypothetical protein